MAEATRNGNGNGGWKSAVGSIIRVAEGVAIAAFIGTAAMTMNMRDDLSEIRSEIRVTQRELESLGALQAQQVSENSRRIQDLLNRIERVESRLFR